MLDVAGGQGALAFEMANLNGLSVTVVDPRPLDLKRLVYECIGLCLMGSRGRPGA